MSDRQTQILFLDWGNGFLQHDPRLCGILLHSTCCFCKPTHLVYSTQHFDSAGQIRQDDHQDRLCLFDQ
jgi:hypothetical protein